MMRTGTANAHRLAQFVAASLVTAFLAGCAQKPAETPGTTTTAPAKPAATAPGKAPNGEPIKIGAIFSVTGPGAPLGTPEKNAIEMLAEQANAKGGVLGRPIEVIVKDNKTDPQETVIAAKDLIDNEKVVAIVGPSDTSTTMAIKDLCEQAKVPLISCAAGKTITDPVASYVFATPQTNALAAEKMVAQAKKEGASSIAVLSVDNGFGKDGLANTEAAAAKEALPIVAKASFAPEDTDMTAQLTQIKGAKPGAVLIWGTNPGPAIAVKNAKTLALGVPIILSHGVANAKFLELAGDAAEGVQLPAGRLIVVDQIAASDPQKELLTKFAADYLAKVKAPADTFAGHAYDAFEITVKAIEKAGAPDRGKVRDAIEQLGEFVGTAGTFRYTAQDHNGLTVEAFVWVKVEGGKWKLAE
jgi:branched-chain amino acid transport system substrate-binding protein